MGPIARRLVTGAAATAVATATMVAPAAAYGPKPPPPLHCHASVSNPHPVIGKARSVTVTVATYSPVVAGAPVMVSAYFEHVTANHFGVTGRFGRFAASFGINAHTVAGYTVHVYAVVAHRAQVGSCSTSFTPIR
jgi:hypothetical protein